MLAVRRSVSADHSYDVALSYLREEHADDARELATRLRKAGYSVFFDEFEEAEMWGQVLEEKLESIYRDEARFCVMFVSAAYIARPWTRHERRVAIARAVRETGYVLPIRYDDSDIPGLPDGVVYRDRRKDSLDTVFGHLVKKLGPPRTPPARPAAAAIQVFPADYVGVVVEKDKASRPILNIRCHVLNAGREAATLSRLEARLEDPDGSSIRMPWNLFWSTGTYRLGFRGWLEGSDAPDVESRVRLDVDPLTVAWWRHWTRASEKEWQAVNDPHNAVAIPLMPLPAA